MAFTPIDLSSVKNGTHPLVSQSTPPPAAPPAKKSVLDSVVGAAKSVGNFFTGSEQGLGTDIATAVTAPHQIDQASAAAATNQRYIQTLIDLKHKNAAEGKPTDHLDHLISTYQPEGFHMPDLPTTGKVLGDAAGTAADILSAGTYGATKTAAMKSGQLAEKVAPSAVSLAAKGVDAGVGAIKNVGDSMAANAAKKETAKVIDLVSPRLTPIKGTKVLTTGAGQAPGLLKNAAIDYSANPSVRRAAEAVQGIVQPGKSFIENTNRVYHAISDISENTVKPFLSANPTPFNFADLRKSFELISPKASLKADPAAYATYDRVRETLLTTLEQHLKSSGDKLNATDFNQVWNGRKVLDSKIQEELGGKVFGTPQYAGVKAAASDFRNGLNKFMTDSLANPGKMEDVNKYTDFLKTARSRGIEITNEGEAINALQKEFGINQSQVDMAKAAFFRANLDKMAGMYEAIGNMAPKAYRELGKNGYQLWIKNHPILSKVAGGAAAAFGAGAAFKVGGDTVSSLGE